MKAVRINGAAAEKLAAIKRNTKLPAMNAIARVALVTALQHKQKPVDSGDSKVVIEWETFAGEREKIYRLLCGGEDASGLVNQGLDGMRVPQSVGAMGELLIRVIE